MHPEWLNKLCAWEARLATFDIKNAYQMILVHNEDELGLAWNTIAWSNIRCSPACKVVRPGISYIFLLDMHWYLWWPKLILKPFCRYLIRYSAYSLSGWDLKCLCHTSHCNRMLVPGTISWFYTGCWKRASVGTARQQWLPLSVQLTCTTMSSSAP